MGQISRREELAQNLKRWFRGQDRFKTYKQVAEAAGISYSSIKDYFEGRALPGLRSRRSLAGLTGIDSCAPGTTEVLSEVPQLFPGTVVGSSTPGAQIDLLKQPARGPAKVMDPDAPPDQANSKGGAVVAADVKAFGVQTYEAYMATALTNLDRTSKIGVVFISDCVARVCSTHRIEVYEPRRATDPVQNATIQDHRVYLLDREKVTMSDLVIVLCEFPSFGAGQEIEIAGNATVPLILLAMADKKPSRMVTGTPVKKLVVEFTDPDDLTENLSDALRVIYPHLEERRRRMAAIPIPIDLGVRIKELRKNARLDQAELGERVGVSEQFIRNLEETGTSITNLSLIHLAALACVLKVPFYELLGECDASGEPIPRDHLRWARDRQLPPARLMQVLDFAARSSTNQRKAEFSSQELDAFLQRLEFYERDLGKLPG